MNDDSPLYIIFYLYIVHLYNVYIYIQTYTHTYYWSVSKSLESSKSCIATTSSPRLFEPSPHEVALLRRLWTARQCAHVQGARPAVISAIRRVGLAQQRTKKCWTSKKTMAYPSYIAIYIYILLHTYIDLRSCDISWCHHGWPATMGIDIWLEILRMGEMVNFCPHVKAS